MSVSETCINELKKHCVNMNEIYEKNGLGKAMVLTEDIEKSVEILIRQMDEKLKNIKSTKELKDVTLLFNKDLDKLIRTINIR